MVDLTPSPSGVLSVPGSLRSGRRLCLVLEYDGGAFAGWQAQAKGERTVQQTLEAALVPFKFIGRAVACGRTDAGVHARAMPVHVDINHELSASRLVAALNNRLPQDLRVLEARDVSPRFHARFSCRWRAYRYRVFNRPVASALEHARALHVSQSLDLEAMNAAARSVLGEHDFAAFASQEERETVRHLFVSRWYRNGDYLEYLVVGESFLRHMVRALVGTCLLVGCGQVRSEHIQAVLESRARSQAGPNVAPHGLYFERAGFEPWLAGAFDEAFIQSFVPGAGLF